MIEVAVQLRAASAGLFDDRLQAPDGYRYKVRVPVGTGIVEGVFLVHIVGRSMEPEILHDSYGFFRRCWAPSHEKRIVLLERRTDDYLACWAVKQLHRGRRSKDDDPLTLRNVTIDAHSKNAAFPDYPLHHRDRTIAEYIRSWDGTGSIVPEPIPEW